MDLYFSIFYCLQLYTAESFALFFKFAVLRTDKFCRSLCNSGFFRASGDTGSSFRYTFCFQPPVNSLESAYVSPRATKTNSPATKLSDKVLSIKHLHARCGRPTPEAFQSDAHIRVQPDKYFLSCFLHGRS